MLGLQDAWRWGAQQRRRMGAVETGPARKRMPELGRVEMTMAGRKMLVMIWMVVVLGMVEAVEVIHGNLDRYSTKQAPRNTTATPQRQLTTFLVRV